MLALFAVHNSAFGQLSLVQAEDIALALDPKIAAAQMKALALKEDAIADGQLSDPKFKFGVYNLPTDTLDFEQEPVTQIRLGVSQAFPRGDTLALKRNQTDWNAEIAQEKGNLHGLRTILNVRLEFLELFYQINSGKIIEQSRELFSNLLGVTHTHYESGRVSQQDVLRAELELSRLEDRAIETRYREEASRSMLRKWIGNAANLDIESNLPILPTLAEKNVISDNLQYHPIIRVESAQIKARQKAVEIDRQQFKPGWTIGIEYRSRFGNNMDGTNRTDFIAAMATVDIPLFPQKRQNKRLSASIYEVSSAQLGREDQMRELLGNLDREYSNWENLGIRAGLYRKRLLRESSANANASLSAYQSGVTDFTVLMRAQITELELQLKDLKIRVDQNKSQARILYLTSGAQQ